MYAIAIVSPYVIIMSSLFMHMHLHSFVSHAPGRPSLDSRQCSFVLVLFLAALYHIDVCIFWNVELDVHGNILGLKV